MRLSHVKIAIGNRKYKNSDSLKRDFYRYEYNMIRIFVGFVMNGREAITY